MVISLSCSRVVLGAILVFTAVSLAMTVYPQQKIPDVHYDATPQSTVEAMLKLAEVTGDDIVYDLGCGDGRFVITAAEKFGARGVGIDIDPARIKESLENAEKRGVSNRVKFIGGDLFEADISEGSVVTLYLLQRLNLELRPKLLNELKPGSRILSYTFDMEDWGPDKRGQLEGKSFYYWIVPANVSGTWQWSIGPEEPTGEKNRFVLDQTFQKVGGKFYIDGKQATLINCRLKGDQIEFGVDDNSAGRRRVMRFHGRVSSNEVRGNCDIQAGSLSRSQEWRAHRIEITPRKENLKRIQSIDWTFSFF
ncbi:MAG TPA: class I SAM-dependent methyltransferase [Thermodesulfobacteriota bacterium]|nr:class I SAM-dependent methyltransferase [Thermodesulfobacteriota bacterium]